MLELVIMPAIAVVIAWYFVNALRKLGKVKVSVNQLNTKWLINSKNELNTIVKNETNDKCKADEIRFNYELRFENSSNEKKQVEDFYLEGFNGKKKVFSEELNDADNSKTFAQQRNFSKIEGFELDRKVINYVNATMTIPLDKVFPENIFITYKVNNKSRSIRIDNV